MAAIRKTRSALLMCFPAATTPWSNVPRSTKSFLRDLGSTNGTFLNNERLTAQRRMRLHTGDAVRIGGKLLSFTGLESQEQKTFGNRVTRMDTVRDGLFYRDGKVVEIPAGSTQDRTTTASRT